MERRMIGKCPVCHDNLKVSRLECKRCGTGIEGAFDICKFCQLPREQLEFVEVFLKCRGSIKDVEKELGISYPTVKSRLEDVLRSLGFLSEESNKAHVGKAAGKAIDPEIKKRILDALEKGEISAQEAVKMLKQE